MKNQNNPSATILSTEAANTNVSNVFANTRYDLTEIRNELRQTACKTDTDKAPTVNYMIFAVFEKGIIELSDCIADKYTSIETVQRRLAELSARPKTSRRNIFAKQQDCAEWLNVLGKMNPDKDIAFWVDPMEPHIAFVKNEELYRKYLSDELKTVEEKMGFPVESSYLTYSY